LRYDDNAHISAPLILYIIIDVLYIVRSYIEHMVLFIYFTLMLHVIITTIYCCISNEPNKISLIKYKTI
jgi:hypothetical protein